MNEETKLDDSYLRGKSKEQNISTVSASEQNKDDLINITEPPSAFEQALADVLVWYGSETAGEWRVHADYRDLFACLTPRQIKFFLRERLLAGKANDDREPAESFLRTLFHPLWKVYRDEPDQFEILTTAASATLKLVPNETRQKGKLSGTASAFFKLHLDDVATRSAVIGTEQIRSCWPQKSEERALLVNLLALMARKGGDGYISDRGAYRASRRSFPDWVRERFGERPVGVTPNEQVSSFQDMALERYHQGEKNALTAVADYADEWLDEHLPMFDASIASSLSNLAVLIDGVSGKEAQCDRLFEEAVRLARPGNRIPFYHAEFLLDVLDDTGRKERLVAARYDGDEKKLRAAASTSLDKLRDDDLEPKDRLYRDILRLRIDWLDKGEDLVARMRAAWNLARTHAQVLLGGGWEPSSRFNDQLDSLIGKGAGCLRTKEPLQGVVWAAQIKAGQPGWPMAVQIANDLVGESLENSLEERCGLGLNAMLVADANLLQVGGKARERIASIWSQTGVVLAKRLGSVAESRIALAFLASLANGGGAQSADRMRQYANKQKLPGDVLRPEVWVELLDDRMRTAYAAYAADPRDAEAARMLADIVFGTDYPRIDTPEQLAKELSWNVALEWADNKTFDEAVAELVAAFRPMGAMS